MSPAPAGAATFEIFIFKEPWCRVASSKDVSAKFVEPQTGSSQTGGFDAEAGA